MVLLTMFNAYSAQNCTTTWTVFIFSVCLTAKLETNPEEGCLCLSGLWFKPVCYETAMRAAGHTQET